MGLKNTTNWSGAGPPQKELRIPLNPGEGGFELLRVWLLSNNKPRYIINWGTGDPAWIGLLLADIARCFARTHAETNKLPLAQVEARLFGTLLAELRHPTDTPRDFILAKEN